MRVVGLVFKLKNNKKVIWPLFFVYLFCLCIGKVAKAGTFVIGVEDVSYYPYFDFTSHKTTFAKALFDQFAKDSGHQISYLPLPIKQFPKWLYEENIDFKFPDNVRWQEKTNIHHLNIHFSDEIVAMTAGTLVMAKNKDKEQAFFKTIGTITGFYPTLWLTQIEQGKVRIYEDSSPKILVKHLVNGHIDGLDIDLAVAKDGMKNLHIQEKLVINNNLTKQLYAYQMSTVKYPEIIKQFNQWLVKRGQYIDDLKAEFGILAVEPRKAVIANQ